MKKWRNLVRVVEVNENNYVVTVPGTGYLNFTVSKDMFATQLEVDQRFYAHVNLEAETDEELGMEKIEMRP